LKKKIKIKIKKVEPMLFSEKFFFNIISSLQPNNSREKQKNGKKVGN